MSKRTLKLIEKGGLDSRAVKWSRKQRELRAIATIRNNTLLQGKSTSNPVAGASSVDNTGLSQGQHNLTISPAQVPFHKTQQPAGFQHEQHSSLHMGLTDTSTQPFDGQSQPTTSGLSGAAAIEVVGAHMSDMDCSAARELSEGIMGNEGNLPGYAGNIPDVSELTSSHQHENNNQHEDVPQVNSIHSDAPIDSSFIGFLGGKVKGNYSNKVCKCVDTTVGDVLFMCLNLGLRHNLTWAAQVDILKMVSTICNCADIPCNKKAYLALVGDRDHSISYNIFCDVCETSLGKKDDQVKETICTQCSQKIDQNSPSNFFLSISLESQLKSLLQNENLAEKLLTHRFKRESREGVLNDIYDGAQYRKHFTADGILRNPFNFSWSFFTDGVATGKSNGKTMWVLYLTLNELPLKDRMKHMLIGGLYVGSKDPNPLVFLKPFVEEGNHLSVEGFSWTYQGKEEVSRVIPLVCIMDSVARWRMMNMQSFHAFYGCTYCYVEQSKTSDHTRRYAFAMSGAEPRTAESTLSDASIALSKRDEPGDPGHHRGVKGPSPLMALKYFDIILGCPVDYMHCLLTGLVKTHMELLFESGRSSFWNMGTNGNVAADHLMTCIDQRLLQIRPPACITRVTRSITQWRIWKASEWRSWLLFYCVPSLLGLLKEEHLVPLIMLSNATCILLQRNVPLDNVTEAHNLYMGYYRYFEEYFDVRHTIYNVHLISHICDCVRNWGPLFVQSALPYEGQNMHLLQLYQSPNHVLLSIARKFLIYKSVPALCGKIVSCESTLEFAENLNASPLSKYMGNAKCLLSMRTTFRSLPEDEREFIQQTIGETPQCSFYQRSLHRGIRVSSCEYVKHKQNDDSVLLCKDGEYVRVTVLVQLPSGEIRLVGRKIDLYPNLVFGRTRASSGITLLHVRRIRCYGTLVCLNITDIVAPVVHITTSTQSFLCGMPFGCYGD